MPQDNDSNFNTDAPLGRILGPAGAVPSKTPEAENLAPSETIAAGYLPKVGPATLDEPPLGRILEPTSANPKQAPAESSFQLPAEAPLGRILGPATPSTLSDEEVQNATRGLVSENAESVFTRPLTTTLFGLPETWSRTGAGPVESGAEKAITSFGTHLLSPLSLGLLIGTWGVGGLAAAGAESAAVPAAEAGAEILGEGVGAAETAMQATGSAARLLEALPAASRPYVVNAARGVSKLANLGFTGQQIYSVGKAIPEFRVALQNGDIQKATEIGTEALLGGALAGMSARHLVENTPWLKDTHEWTADREVIGAYQQQVEKHNVEAMQFERENRPILRNKDLDLSAMLFHEAGGTQPSSLATLDRWQNELRDTSIKPAVRDRYISLLEQAKRIPAEHPEIVALSDRLRKDYADDWTEIVQGGKEPRRGALNYAGEHTYNPKDADESTLRPTRYGPTKRPSFLQKRGFDNLIDAVKVGFEPSNEGLAAARLIYTRKFGMMRGAIAAEDTLLRLKANDGRPMAINPNAVRAFGRKLGVAVPQGTDLSRYPEAEQAKLFEVRSVGQGEDQNYDVRSLGENRPLGVAFVDTAAARSSGFRPYFDVTDYRDAREPFLRYRVIGQHADGSPVFERAPILLHPEFADTIIQTFSDTSWFRKSPIFGPALKVSSQAKQLLLTLSPFHWLTEGLRGLSMGLNPVEIFNPPELSPERLAVTTGTKYGLTLLGDQASRAAMAEGVGQSGLLSKIPGLGPVLDSVQRALFENWIPRLKAITWERMVTQLEKMNPYWSEEQRYALAGKITNAAYGGLNWKQLGVSLSSQDALRLIALAPDFTGSEVLFSKYALEAGGTPAWQAFARIGLYNFAVAQTINLLVSGKIHPETPFSVQSPDGSKKFSVRTMPEDVFHLLSDPRSFVYNRLNPLLVRTGVEATTGRDIAGHRVTGEQEVLDMLRNVLPISLNTLVPKFQKANESWWSGPTKSLGVTVQRNTSPALELAQQLASNRAETGPVDSAKLAHHQFINDLEKSIEDKKFSRSVLSTLEDQGVLTKKEKAEIIKRLDEVAKIKDPAVVDLALKVQHLPLTEALQVWNLADNRERTTLAPILRKKALAYKKLTLHNLTARERLRDPLLLKLKEVEGPSGPSPKVGGNLQAAESSQQAAPISGKNRPWEKGMIARGNIKLEGRPVIHNADGSQSTIYSETIALDKNGNIWTGDYDKAPQYALIPTIVNGKFLSPNGKMPKTGSLEEKTMFQRAEEYYQKTHQHLGIFDSDAHADKYAETTHAWRSYDKPEEAR